MRGVSAPDREQAGADRLIRDPGADQPGDVVQRLASGFDCDGVDRLFHTPVLGIPPGARNGVPVLTTA